MKAIYKYLQTVGLVICTCLMLSACDDFLDTKPYDFVAPETFYTNESGVKWLLLVYIIRLFMRKFMGIFIRV